MQTENKQKPMVKLVGQDGNIFNLIGIASRELKRAGQQNEAKDMQEKVFSAESYDEALSIIGEYCEIK